MSNLDNKVAVVTGASKGIGAAIAKHLAAAGATVVVGYSSSKEGAEKTVADIAARGGKAIAVKASVPDEAEIAALFDTVKKKYGKIDILVNNAGVYEFSPLDGFTLEHYNRQFNTNVLGVLLTTQSGLAAVPAERRQRGQYKFRGQHAGAANGLGVFGHQGSDRFHHPLPRQGTGAPQNPRQCRESGTGQDRRIGGLRRQRLRKGRHRLRRRSGASASRTISRCRRCSWPRRMPAGSPARRCTCRGARPFERVRRTVPATARAQASMGVPDDQLRKVGDYFAIQAIGEGLIASRRDCTRQRIGFAGSRVAGVHNIRALETSSLVWTKPMHCP